MAAASRISVEVAQRLLDGSPFGRWWGYRMEAVTHHVLTYLRPEASSGPGR